jgi:hypothetical protein
MIGHHWDADETTMMHDMRLERLYAERVKLTLQLGVVKEK